MKTWHVVALAASIFLGLVLSGGIYDIAPAGVGGGEDEPGGVCKVNRFTGHVWWIWGVHERDASGAD